MTPTGPCISKTVGTVYCVSCGKVLGESESQFCPHCGALQPATPELLTSVPVWIQAFAFNLPNPISVAETLASEAEALIEQDVRAYLTSWLAARGKAQVSLLVSLKVEQVGELPKTKTEAYAERSSKLGRYLMVAWLLAGVPIILVPNVLGVPFLWALGGYVTAFSSIATLAIFFRLRSRTSATVQIKGKRVRRKKLDHVPQFIRPVPLSPVVLSNSVPWYSVCTACKGNRFELSSIVCSTCRGTGTPWKNVNDDRSPPQEVCWRCQGKGRIELKNMCQICRGLGGFQNREVVGRYNERVYAFNEKLRQLNARGLAAKIDQLNAIVDELNLKVDLWNSKFE
jgi:predicted amidophosphoribosyltransferase